MPQIPAIQPYVLPTQTKAPSFPTEAKTDFADLVDKVASVADQVETVAQDAEAAVKDAAGKDPVEAAVEDVPEILKPDEPPADTDAADALAAIMDGLAQLQAAMQKGETPDPELMNRLSQAIDKLAGQLGVSLDAMPTAEDLANMATRPPVPGEPIQAQLQKILSPAALALTADPERPDLTALGNKLGALLKAMDGAEPAKVSALQPAIEQLVAKLPQPAAPTAPGLPAPPPPTPSAPTTLADAEVKLAEPKLAVPATETAKPETSASASSTSAAPTPAKAAADSSHTKGRHNDAKSDAAAQIVAAAAETKQDAQAPGQTAPQQAKAEIAAAVAPRPIMPGYQTNQQQLNLPQLAFEVARQANGGNTHFQIRLDPAELGRIDVKLDIDANGQVNARLTVERAETLDLMQRDQRGLEKALQQAGLDGAKTNLEFSLKQNPFAQSQGGQDGQGRPSLFGEQQGGGESEDGPIPTVNLYRGNLSASGVNILA